jgi:hypothetical protein
METWRSPTASADASSSWHRSSMFLRTACRLIDAFTVSYIIITPFLCGTVSFYSFGGL